MKDKDHSMLGRARALVYTFSQISTAMKLKSQFRRAGSTVQFPVRATNIGNLRIGSHVFLGSDAWLDLGERIKVCVGDNTEIGRSCQISGGWGEHEEHVWIGKNVLIGDRVFMTTSDHDYTDVTKPVVEQKIVSKGNIRIEDDSWIGIGVCVLSNVRIGKHAVIGANAVVVDDVPQYSVAVGNPARVVKKYDSELGMWTKVK